MKKFMSGLFSILLIISYVGAFIMHLYTSWLCNLAFGAFWGIITFLTPPFSDLIMAGIIIQENGIINPFIIEWAAVLCLYIVPMFTFERSNDKSLAPKTRYCRRCGSQLDQNHKCSGCGKQYFNFFRSFREGIRKRINALSVSLIIAVCIIIPVAAALNSQLVSQNAKIESMQKELEKAKETETIVTQMKEDRKNTNIEIRKLYEQIDSLDKKSKFLDFYVGITTETGTKFHKYGCPLLDENQYAGVGSTKFLIEIAGYEPCAVCHTQEEINLYSHSSNK